MRFRQTLDRVSSADTTISIAEQGLGRIEANGAIPVGSLIVLDTTITTGRKAVVAPTSIANSLLLGIYTGNGGTGAEVAASGTDATGVTRSGRAAVAGDFIDFVSYGYCVILADATTTWIKPGYSLIPCDGTAGRLMTSGAAGVTVQANYQLVALDTLNTTSTAGAIQAFIGVM